MESTPLLDCAGRLRSPATMSSFHQGLTPRNKGLRYPPDPPTVEEIVAVMRAAGDSPEGLRLRGIIIVLWRAGLRVSEALALNETDLDPDRGSLLVRHRKGDRPREVGMDRWAWTHLDPWLDLRGVLPVGRLFCVMRGPTRGRPCASAGIRAQLHHAAAIAGVRRTQNPIATQSPSPCAMRLASVPSPVAVSSRSKHWSGSLGVIVGLDDRRLRGGVRRLKATRTCAPRR